MLLRGSGASSVVPNHRGVFRRPPPSPIDAFAGRTSLSPRPITLSGPTSPTDARAPAPPASYPLLLVSPGGWITVLLHHDVVFEIAVDHSFRLTTRDQFSSEHADRPSRAVLLAFVYDPLTNATAGNEARAALVHHHTRVLAVDRKIFARFIGQNGTADKQCVIGDAGVVFGCVQQPHAYLVTPASQQQARGASRSHTQNQVRTRIISMSQHSFPDLGDQDYSLSLFYANSHLNKEMVPICRRLVTESKQTTLPDGTLELHVADFVVRQAMDGRVRVSCDERSLNAFIDPVRMTGQLRAAYIDLSVQEGGRAYVKRGSKRFHSSGSGMVASVGGFVTSVDHAGRLVSTTNGATETF